MFTGIVEEIGTIRQHGGDRLAISAKRVLVELAPGDSIAVNGVCLTVVAFDHASFTVDVMPETLRRTNLGVLRTGGRVNLERAVSPSSRMGGHFVQGHIDDTGRVESVRPEERAKLVTVAAAPKVMRYVVEKGFIAVDGTSLTVAQRGDYAFTVSLVAFTQQNTILADCCAGDVVNLEVDILGKYVEQLVGRVQSSSTRISEEFLAEHGFIR